MLMDEMLFLSQSSSKMKQLNDISFTPDAAASAAAEVDPAPHLAAGLLLGGDAQQLDASTRAFAKGSMKALVNLVSEIPQKRCMFSPESLLYVAAARRHFRLFRGGL